MVLVGFSRTLDVLVDLSRILQALAGLSRQDFSGFSRP